MGIAFPALVSGKFLQKQKCTQKLCREENLQNKKELTAVGFPSAGQQIPKLHSAAAAIPRRFSLPSGSGGHFHKGHWLSIQAAVQCVVILCPLVSETPCTVSACATPGNKHL